MSPQGSDATPVVNTKAKDTDTVSPSTDTAMRDSGVESWANQNSPGRTSPDEQPATANKTSQLANKSSQLPIRRDIAAALAVHLQLCLDCLHVSN